MKLWDVEISHTATVHLNMVPARNADDAAAAALLVLGGSLRDVEITKVSEYQPEKLN